MPDMQKLSELQLPDGSEYYVQDNSAIASISRSGNTFTATKRNGDTFTFSQKDITISSNPSNPNIITITDNDGNTYDVDIVISDATQSASGLMSASDKTKLDGVASGAEVNQFAFSAVEVTQGQTVTTLSADSKTDTLSIVAGDNITLTPTAVSDRVVFSAKDTTYTLIQDSTDKHKFTLHDSDGNDTTITIPDNDTTYTLSADPATGKIVLTPSSGSPISITVPNATHADSATADEDGDDIRTTYATSLGQNPSDGHVLQLKDKNGNVLSTATVPDNNTTYTFENGTNGFSVTPSGGSKQTVKVTPSIADATQSKSGLMSANDKKKLDGVEAGADVNVIESVKVNGTALTPDANKAVNVTVPTKTSDLTNDSDYVSDASYVHTDNNYTSTEKSKLAGIASGAEVNQNAFSNVKVGTTTIAADGKTDTLELSAGSNISLTPDATNDKVTIAVTGLGTAAAKNFTTSVTSGSGDLVTSGAVASAISTAIDNLPEPMIFKGTLGTNGTITSLPTASSSNEGWTYKVITAGTYASQAAKVGDMFVSTKIDSAYQWVYIPSGDDVEDTWRNIKINGTEKLGTGISSGAIDFVNGSATTVSFNATGNKVSISHADTSSQASVNNSGRTYVQDITLDEYGHVTGIASATETVTNTDRYVNTASFADDTTASANSPVKMTLTRAGSDTASVTANIPKVSASSAGVAPKGSAVSSQSQSTKFLREDGSWAAPTYTVNTDTKVTAVGNHYTPAENTGSQLDADASSTTAATWNSTSLVTGVTIKRDAKGHVTGLAVDSIKMPANPNTNTTYTFAEGSTNGAFSVTPSGGSAQSVPVHGLKSAAYTESSAYATSGHTHATSIATSTGTNQITLAHGGKYAITAGGTSYIFTMPSDNNTDTLVTQTATNTNATYEVLFSATADNTTRTETARKNNNLTFNPSTGTLSTTNVSASSAIATNDLDTNYLTTGSASITEANVGNLIVTGAARFLNTINGSISGNAATASDSAKLNGYASDTAASNNTIARRTASGYIFAKYFNQSSSAETPTSDSFIIYANSDGYFRKSTVANMKTAMSLNNVENKSSATIRSELTSSNVTTALGYTPVNKAGDTITGRIAYNNVSMPLSAGKVTSLAAGTTEIFKDGIAISNPATFYDVGWIRVTGTGESDTVLEIATGDDGGMTNCEKTVVRQYNTSNAVAREAVLLNTDGTSSFPVSVTAPKFIGNLQGTADNADKVDGYHIYYDRYVSSTQLAQPTADTVWYVKVSTANWNSHIEVIQIRTGGNNRVGCHVLYTGSRGTKWWGYGQVYSHRGLSGVYKVISNSDDVYLRFDADCTSATIYTSFTPQTIAIVDSPSGAYYTEVPTYGGWYGNQITVDHIQTNNYITIQKPTVASSTFADSNPKIVFKNADGSQSGSLTWTDYDSVQSPASLTLNGTQGGEYFIAPNIKATGSFYGNLSGNASTATSATKATQDSDGNTIKSTYLKLAGGTLTGTLQLGSSTQSTLPTCGIHVHDVRSVDITTNCMRYQSNFFFSNRSMPDGNFWSLLHVRGWNEDAYNTWELAGPANAGDQRTTPLYVRSSNGTTWGSWRKIFDSSNKPTKSDVGLGNVDNTADANKSVNYATSAGSATKATQDSDGNAINTTYLKKSGGTLTGAINTANNTYNNIGDDVAIGDINVAGTLGVKGLNGATGIQLVPYSGSTAQKISINGSGTMTITGTVASTFSGNLTGNADSATLLNQDTTYKEGTAYVCQTSAGTVKAFCSRANNSNIGLSTSGYGCMLLSATWGGGTNYNGELFMGMGDFPNLYFRGKNNGTYTSWNAIGQFTATPTSGQVVITNGTTGGMKSSGYTIATSVPSGAKFTDTDTKNTAGSTDTSSKIFLIGATSQAANPQTYSQDTAYVGTDGCLYSGGTKVLTAHQDISGKVSKTGDTMTGCLSITSANSSWAEGIRINRGNGGYCSFVMGGAANSTSGTGDNVWWLGCNPSSYSHKWFVAHNGSTQTGTYFYVDSSTQQSPHFRVGGDLAVGSKTTTSKSCTLRYNDTTSSMDFIFTA